MGFHFLLFGHFDEVDLLGVVSIVLLIGLTILLGRRRHVRFPLRVVQMWGRTVLEERSVDRSVVVGHGPRSDFATPNLGLPPLYTLWAMSWRAKIAGIAVYVGCGLLAAGCVVLGVLDRNPQPLLGLIGVLGLYLACMRFLPRVWRVVLGPGMTGELSVNGHKREVDGILDEAQGGWRAVVLAPGDWGVIKLGDEGLHSFYFQLAPSPKHIGTAVGRGTEYLMSAVAFAVTFHAILVGMTYLFSTWPPPGGSSLGGYVIHLSQQPPKLEEKKEKKEKSKEPSAGLEDGDTKQTKAAASQDKEGKQGGEGKKPRAATDKPPPKNAVSAKVEKALNPFRQSLGDITGPTSADARLQLAMARVGDNGFGPGKGTGVGPGSGVGTSTRGGTGAGGGGKSPYDVVSRGPIDTGTGRPPKGSPAGTKVTETKVSVSTGTPEGDFGGLTPEQVRAVVEKHKSAIQYCFEKELQKDPHLNGKVVITWRIDPSGTVTTSKVRTSSINNADVEDCLTRQVRKWPFPQATNGQFTNVNFPFLFSGH